MPFPQEWRVILVLDHQAQGLHGVAEVDAFRALPRFSCEGVGEICRLVLTGALPALGQTDFEGFGTAITSIQKMVGMHFAPAQGGIFTSPKVAQAMACLQAAGASGIGQSSWGPTGFAFAPSQEAAHAIIDAAGLSGDADVMIVRGRNAGATITVNDLDLVAN